MRVIPEIVLMIGLGIVLRTILETAARRKEFGKEALTMTEQELKRKAREIRKLIIESVYRAQSGHPGGALSISEMMSVLFFEKMRIDPERKDAPDRDRFVLSKGHGAPAYYAALALRGYFPPEDMKTLRQIGSYLQGHPAIHKIPGVDMSTGSLGQGLSAANGMAINGKAKGLPYRVYCICGDGEMQEGEIWEAIMTAAHYGLDNLTLFVDCNGLQIDGAVKDVMNDLPMVPRLTAFGWNAVEIDGHNIEAIRRALVLAEETKGRPTAIVCRTVKGKGVSYMENQAGWHGSAPNKEQYEQAMAELSDAEEVEYG